MKGFCQKTTEITFRRNAAMNQYIERVLNETKAKNANEPEFLQTVEELSLIHI